MESIILETVVSIIVVYTTLRSINLKHSNQLVNIYYDVIPYDDVKISFTIISRPIYVKVERIVVVKLLDTYNIDIGKMDHKFVIVIYGLGCLNF